MNFQRVLSVGLWLAFVILLGLAFTGREANLAAQSFRGIIRGEVTDAHGLHVPGAKVVARNVGTSETREVTADTDGEYRFVELPAGEYEVSAMATGFEEVHTPKVRVEVGAETLVNLALSEVKGQQEHVEVVENVPLVETSSTTLSQVVDRALMQELPLNGRDFGKLVALTPGVTVEGSGVAGSEKGFGQYNINGNRDRSNNYNLDGTDNNDPFFNNSALNQVGITGAPATLLPLDAVQEFNLQSQFGAEYGRNSGSVVNIVTRSGSNEFHGSLYEYNRNSAFDARNYFNTKFQEDGTPNPQSLFNNNNFGGSLGGPIVKDKLFFFFAYEGQRERVGSDFTLTVPSRAQLARAQNLAVNTTVPGAAVPSVNPGLLKITDLFPTSDTNSLAYSVRDKNDGNNLIGKADFRLSQNNSLSARYAFGQSDQVFPLGSLGGYGSGSRLTNFTQISPTRVQVLSVNWLTMFSPTKINEVRFGYSRFRTSFDSADATPGNPNYIDPTALGLDMGTGHVGLPEIDFNGDLENLGATGYSVPRGRLSETFQVLDNFTLIRGHHTIKFGGEYHRYDVQSFNDNLERGLLDVNKCWFIDDNTCPTLSDEPIVNELANFYIGNIFAVGNTGNTARFTFNNNLGFFMQDEVRVRPNLTVTAGLRWEYFSPLAEKRNLLSNFDASGNLAQVGSPTLPNIYHRDMNNFGPRLGISWSPLANTVVRAAYGLYYDYTPQNNIIANYTSSAGLATNPVPSLSSSPYFVGAQDFNSAAWNGTASGPVFAPTVFPQSIFVTDLGLRTPYAQSWNLNIQREVNKALAFEVGYVGSKGTRLTRLYDANQNRATSDTPTYPDWSAVDVFSGGANSTYHGLQNTVRLQQFHGFSGFSTYTWSKSLDGASDGINFNFANAAFPQNSTNLQAEKGPSTFDTRNRWTTAINYAVPDIEKLPRVLGAGWQLNTIITVQSGRPINVLTDSGGINFNYVQRPDLVPGVNPILSRWTPTTGYLNPNAFAYPAVTAADPNGFFGNLGRDQIFGPGFWDLDFSVTKNFQLGEKVQLQFRSEFFNIFNHPNFALPSNTVSPGSPTAGLITQTPDVAQGNPGLGGGGPRVMQFGLRLQF